MRATDGLVITLLLLLIATLSFTAAPQAPAYTPHKLALSFRSQAEALMSKGDYVGAGPLLERWLEADPHDYNSWYNLACVYSKDRKSVV